MLIDIKMIALAHSQTGCSCNLLQYASESGQQQPRSCQQAPEPMRLLLPSYADFVVAGGFAVDFLAPPLTLNWCGDHYCHML